MTTSPRRGRPPKTKTSNTNTSITSDTTSTTAPDTVTPTTSYTPMNDNNRNKTEQQAAKDKFREIDDKVTTTIDKIARWSLLAFSIPVRIIGSVAENFVTWNSVGAKIVGVLMFLFGVTYSADTYWVASGNSMIYPFFTFSKEWGWLAFFNPFFYVLCFVALGVTLLQSTALRRDADAIKEEIERQKMHGKMTPPPDSRRAVSALVKQYNNAGNNELRVLSLISAASYALDFAATFSGRNPMNYGFGGFFVVTAWNILSLFFGEIGFTMMMATKKTKPKKSNAE